MDFPKTHDIEALLALWSEEIRLGLTAAEPRRLTNYATLTRYPGDYEPISLDEARQAVRLARRVRREIRRLLPKAARRRRR